MIRTRVSSAANEACLEIQLQPKLDDPGVLRGQNLSERARVPPDVRRVEVRVVKRVEYFSAKLEVSCFRESNPLGEREVGAYKARAAHDAYPGGSERLRCRAERCECIRIEPSLDRALGFWQIRITDQIRTRLTFTPQIQHSASSQRRRKSQSTLDGMDAGNLPPTQNPVHRT